MASGRGGCRARKLLLQPGTTTETHHPLLMQGHDKRVLVQGRLGAENREGGGALLIHYFKWKSYVVKSMLGRGLWKKTGV